MQYLYAIGDFSGPDGQYQTMAPFGKNKTLSEDSVYTMDTTSLNAIISKLMVFFNNTLIPTPGLSSGLLSPLFLYESQNLTQSLQSMDEAMTDNIRSASEISSRIAGRAYSNVTFIHVRWPWIILPVAVVVLSIILLGATIISSRQLKAILWKSSLLPLITGTLETQTDFGQARGVDELVNMSKKVEVRMGDRNPPLFSEQ